MAESGCSVSVSKTTRRNLGDVPGSSARGGESPGVESKRPNLITPSDPSLGRAEAVIPRVRRVRRLPWRQLEHPRVAPTAVARVDLRAEPASAPHE